MTPVDAERILNNARIHVPGALDDVLKLELYNTVREFCNGSDIWRQEVPVKIVADRAEYDLAHAEAEPARLILLTDKSGVQIPATMPEPGTIILRTTTSGTDQYIATISLLPDKTDEDDMPVVPDWIAKKYWEDLKDGLVARMMAHPAKPYSNATLALYHMRKFRAGMANAKANAAHANLYGGQTWAFPGIAPTRRK